MSRERVEKPETEQKPEQPKPSPRNWQELAKQYRSIGIASVAAAAGMLAAREPQQVPQRARVRYIADRQG